MIFFTRPQQKNSFHEYLFSPCNDNDRNNNLVIDDADKTTCDGRVMITREMNFETNDDAESWEWCRWDDDDEGNDKMVVDNDEMTYMTRQWWWEW